MLIGVVFLAIGVIGSQLVSGYITTLFGLFSLVGIIMLIAGAVSNAHSRESKKTSKK